MRLLELLDDLDVDWGEVDDNGYSLMRFAAQLTNLTHSQFLLDKDLDPRLEDNKQQTPLDLASIHGATNILPLFEKDK